MGNAGAHFENSRWTRIRGWLWSTNADAEQKGFELRWTWDSAEIQDLHNGGNGQRRSANKRGSTTVHSRSWSLRGGANARWHACSSITWNTLWRTQIFLWVGQRSKATVDQRGEDKCMQNGKHRSSCCPWIVVQFWYQFVLRIDIAGLDKHIFKLSNRAKWRNPYQETGAIHQQLKTERKKGITIGLRRSVCETFQNG